MKPGVGPRPTLRIGVAGLGQAGSAIVPAILRHPHAVVTAVADPRPELVEAFARDHDVEAHAGVESLAASSVVDLVYLGTPTHLHCAHALLAAAHGKHVIVEKPMALTLDEAAAMTAEARRRGVHLIVGHSQSFEPPIRGMRELVRGGSLGRMTMAHTWFYGDWLYRPRTPAELDTSLGGGVVFRQGAHQADILRWIGGGMVRSVRAVAGAWDPARPAEGNHTILLDFADGSVATAVYSGYDHLPGRELTFGVGEDGQRRRPSVPGRARAVLAAVAGDGESTLKRALGYGARRTASPRTARHASFYGLTVVSCERGDIRQVPGGLRVYGDSASWDVPIPATPTGRDLLLDEAYEAVANDRAPAHGGAWGTANLEVCLAALESSRTRREVLLAHQAPTPDT